MPHMSLVTAGRSSIKVSAVCLCLSCARPVCTVIMDDSTTGYGVINRAPPVIVCCVRGIFSPNFSTNPSLLAFNLLRRWSAIWAKAPAPPWALWLRSLQLRAAGAGVMLQADSDPGRGWGRTSPVFSSLEMSMGCVCVGGFRGEWSLEVSLYCASLCPIQLCGDLAGLLCPLGRAREGEVEGRDPCGARVGRRC